MNSSVVPTGPTTWYNYWTQCSDTKSATRPEKVGHIHGDIAYLSGNGKYQSATIFKDRKSKYVHCRFDTTKKPTADEALVWISKLQEQLKANNHTLCSL